MKLNDESIGSESEWLSKGYSLPNFDRTAMIAGTKKNPVWVHFGAGNIFRAFQANAMQQMLNKGYMNRGLTVAEGYDYEIISRMYRPHDNLSILVTLKSDGTVEKTVVGSIAESVALDSHDEAQFARMKEIFAMDSLQMASFTITEKGYSLVNGRGEQLPAVTADMEQGPGKPESYIGKVVSLLYARFLAGEKPIAMVSMDNCSHNGSRLYDAAAAFADKWTAAGLAESGFADYINDPSKVSFPWSMIDKITPRPDDRVKRILNDDGVEELDAVITEKKTYVAPFVNSEETQYLVIEDWFPNGRPALERAGIMFTDRDTVDKVEKMKVCTCLNPLHTALAIFGCLLGYDLISEEMKDETLVKLVKGIGYDEGLPAAVDPGIISPRDFLDTVVEKRIPNPYMPDTPQRIATDTSQKLPIRYGETIKAYMKSDTLKVSDLKLIPLVFAGWLRYLMAVDDEGNKFELSPDPRLDALCPTVGKFRLGDTSDKYELQQILADASIFGVDLFETGMADKVLGCFDEMLAGKGAVRKTLEKYV